MSTSTIAARTSVVRQAMNDIRDIESELGVTRPGVEAIRDRLIALSEERELFSVEDFAPPSPQDKRTSRLYRLSQEPDDRFALYLQSSLGDVQTPVHDHTTWASVVGVHGQELNRFFDRTDDGVVQTHEHVVEAGTGIAMLPDELHSIHINGRALNFHCYGHALETLTERQYFNPSEKRWKPFSSVSGIIEARPEMLDS